MLFVTEVMYRNLVSLRIQGAPESVHLSDWPDAADYPVDTHLARSVALGRRLSRLGRSAREQAKVRVRQPLAEVIVVIPEKEAALLDVIGEQLLDELNVKKLTGGAEGLGKSIAGRLSVEGGQVFLFDRNQDFLAATQGEFLQDGLKV